MKLASLLTVDAVSDARFAGLDVRGVSADSRTVKPGDLFVAVAGTKADGLRFVDQALAAGAAAVMAERVPPKPLPDGVAFVRVHDARRALALAAAKFFPRQPEVIAAVTGTSGKTSVAAFTRQIWAALGEAAASIGTIGLVSPAQRGLRLADDARSGRAAPLARPARGRGRHPSRDRSVLARARSAPARRRARSRRAASPISPAIISTITRRLKPISPPSCGCSPSWCSRRRRGDRRRSRTRRRGGRGRQAARACAC